MIHPSVASVSLDASSSFLPATPTLSPHARTLPSPATHPPGHGCHARRQLLRPARESACGRARRRPSRWPVVARRRPSRCPAGARRARCATGPPQQAEAAQRGLTSWRSGRATHPARRARRATWSDLPCFSPSHLLIWLRCSYTVVFPADANEVDDDS